MSSPHTPDRCPFCGEKLVTNDNPADLYVRRYGPHYHHLTTSTCYLAEDEVSPGSIESWNTRAAPEPLTDERADAERLDWLERHDGRFADIDRITSVVGSGFNGLPSLRAAIDAAMKERP